jgi:hypothetical protein
MRSVSQEPLPRVEFGATIEEGSHGEREGSPTQREEETQEDEGLQARLDSERVLRHAWSVIRTFRTSPRQERSIVRFV